MAPSPTSPWKWGSDTDAHVMGGAVASSETCAPMTLENSTHPHSFLRCKYSALPCYLPGLGCGLGLGVSASGFGFEVPAPGFRKLPWNASESLIPHAGPCSWTMSQAFPVSARGFHRTSDGAWNTAGLSGLWFRFLGVQGLGFS